ncbi:phage tail protein [Jiella endophytica]|uniref:Phage tail protein n=1 Tax=Jiella endophytica TaxID=2558362 RepID=A0A4Y8RGX0_9HYPH|nr:phage major tail tube protein [Jiella endophytica]TFF20827.1 phage tail protein [Jiella endophytica]
MASRKPAFIMKNCSLSIEGDVRIGQCKQITIPVLERKMEEFRNNGMIKPREVTMGYEVTRTTFTETAFDPDVISLFGLINGHNRNIVAYGYLESEDGREHGAQYEMVADFIKQDFGDWEAGEQAEAEYELTVHSGRLVVDGRELYAYDDLDVTIGGVRQQPFKATALRYV